jgi:hypothetical protein
VIVGGTQAWEEGRVAVGVAWEEAWQVRRA